MVLVVCFAFVSAICQVWAIRQTGDVTDVSLGALHTGLNRNQQGSRESNGEDVAQAGNQVEQAKIRVRKQEAIAGHNSLNTLTVYSLRAENGECQHVSELISDYAKEQMLLPSEAGRSIDKTLDEAWLRDTGSNGPKELSEAFAVLDQLDLRDAMKTNEVWTLGDQDTLIRCETNQIIRVEEETQTDAGTELFEGDMLVPADETSSSLLEMKASIATGASWFGETWPKDGEAQTYMPYCFDPNIHEEAKIAFLKALNHTETQLPCLHFVEVGYNDGLHDRDFGMGLKIQGMKKTTKPNSCAVIPSVKVQNVDTEKCWSYVGFKSSFFLEGESQPLNLGYPCGTMAVAAHELGHALGMLHEQSGYIRDEFVTVHWDNIPEEKWHNFAQTAERYDEISQLQYFWELRGEVPYDPLSLMHYDPEAFAIDASQPTLTANNPKMTRLFGQRLGWSEKDLLKLGKKYCLPQGESDASIGDVLKPLVKQSELLSRFNPIDWNCIKFTPCPSHSNFCESLHNTQCICEVANVCWRTLRIYCAVGLKSKNGYIEIPPGEGYRLIHPKLNLNLSIDTNFCSVNGTK
jgi:hypothetical protein